MSYISFTDDTGAATLDNGLRSIAGGVASRFSNWNAKAHAVGADAVALGTGIPYQFTFRTDQTARFQMEQLPASTQAVALRLMAWLQRGGSCVAYTEDDSGRYYTCYLAPGGACEYALVDRVQMLYTMTLELLESTGAPMFCVWPT